MGSPLPLLLTPRAALVVLQHVATHPAQPPLEAQDALHVSHQTWYASTRRLESLGLVAPMRGPARRKVKAFEVTPEGERILAHLQSIAAEVAHSPAGLEWELQHGPALKGSARVGEVLCRLIEFAERHNDFRELRRLEARAKDLGRMGESHLAREVGALLKGQPREAQAAGEAALALLKRETNTRSLRKAMFALAASYWYAGLTSEAVRTAIEARVLAWRAGDLEAEVDGWMTLGVFHVRLEHHADAIKHLERALALAEKHGLAAKRAKILGNLCFAKAMLDERSGMATADEALRSARKLGATVLVARAQLNRALLLAVLGRPDDARRAMSEARHLLSEGGEEKGEAMLEGWGRLVKQISRHRQGPYPGDWRAQALSLARSRPKPEPGEPPA